MRTGSLCTGYGGLDLATGGDLAWYSEIDTGPTAILAHHYPTVPNLGDMTETDWTGVEPVDVLTAGFPCQPVSHAGKQRGADDERWLWDDVARAVRVLRPGHVVLENVRGLLTASRGRLFGRVLGDLARLGYDARWEGVRASDIGAPHQRWRVFVVATDTTRVTRGGPQPNHLGAATGPTPEPRERTSGHVLPTPRTSDANGAGGHGTGGPDLRTVVSLLPTPAVNDMGAGKTPEAWDAWTDRMKAKHGNGNGHGNSLSIEAQRLLPTPTARDWKDGANVDNVPVNGLLGRTVWPRVDWGKYEAAIQRWETITRPAPPPTQPGKTGRPQLAPEFVEWMMGLPQGWVTGVPGLTRSQMLKALGNGVVPQQAAHALRILT